MLFTPIYNWPYLERYTDPLDYPAISGERMLLAIEPVVADIDERLTVVEAKTDALDLAWTNYTPVITGLNGTAPSAGVSHNITGRWKDIDNYLSHIEVYLIGLGAASWGTATRWAISTPWNITTTSRDMSCGSGHLLDNGTQEYSCVVRPESISTLRMFAGTSDVGQGAPFSWNTNDTLRLSIAVERA